MTKLILIGLPGSGKSSVGRQLARRLGLSFFDSDHVIEQRIGCSIRDYFELQGEAAFRDIEESVIHELVQAESYVLATGGGAVLRPINRQRLGAAGHVVYLSAKPEEVFRRLRRDTARPLLQVNDLLGQLRSLFEERDPLYREIAHFIVEAGRNSTAGRVTILLTQLKLAGVLPAHS